MQYSTKNIILGMSLTASVILTAVVGVSTYQFVSFVNQSQISQHVAEAAADVSNTLVNAETGQRGYIITADEEYLQPYNTSMLTIDGQLEYLKSTTNSQQHVHVDVDNIIQLAKAKMEGLARGIIQRRDQGFEVAQQAFSANHNLGKQRMDEVRALVAGINYQELVRTEKLNVQIREQSKIMSIGLVLLLFFVLIDVALFNNYYKSKNMDHLAVD